MPLQIVRNDITQMQVDAIVNAAKGTLLGGGGVDGAIHRAAGPALLEECRTLHGCKTGQAKLTKGYLLPAKYVIHTVGPVWRGGGFGESALLRSCYWTSLSLAKEAGCESVAFPLISAGAYGYPKDKAIRVAVDTITQFLEQSDMLVYLVIFGREEFQIESKLLSNLQAYIDEHYVHMHAVTRGLSLDFPQSGEKSSQTMAGSSIPGSWKTELEQVDESFSEMLLRKIDEKGMTDAQCCKKANIDRKLLSMIRSDKYYKPGKPTVLAFAIALELSLAETGQLLQKANFALCSSSKLDIIVEFFIQKGSYDVFQINEALFAFDQSLLGG